MKKNNKLEDRRKKIPQDVKIYVAMAFKLADQIEAILKKQGRTQREFATAMGKSESEISKWLTGEHNFTLRSIAKMQAVLGEPIILFPLDLQEKLEKKMQVFVFGGNDSNISAVIGKVKSNWKSGEKEENHFALFSRAQDTETMEVNAIPYMN